MFLLASVGLAFAVDSPSFDLPRGVYESAQTLTLESAPGETIYLSLDGGLPSTPYTGPLRIESTTVVRALAEDPAGERSAVATHTYVFVDDVLLQPAMSTAITADPAYAERIQATLSELPTLSVSLGGPLGTDEAAVSFEYFDPQGALSVQIDCGAARVGGHSLGYAKNNVRLYFRKTYGEGRLDADFFAELDPTGVPSIDRHDSLDLRGGAHDSVFYLGARGQYLRNMWMDETELEMGHIAPHGRFAHLYLDGEYTGLYHLRERFDAALLAEHLGGTEDDYSAVNGGRAVDGTSASWDAIEAASSDYLAFATWVDVDQYLDYIVLNLFAANTWDWNPYQNWLAAGPDAATQGWVFHSSDSDIGLYYAVDHWVLEQPGPGYTLSGLLAEGHPDFMVGLMDALHRNLRTGGPLGSERAAERYAELAPQIQDAVVAEAARWGGGSWDPALHWEVERDYLVHDWLPLRGQELLADAAEAGWMPLPAPELSDPSGELDPGTTVQLSVPADIDAELIVRRDGGDPRMPGGAIAPEAVDAGRVLRLTLDQGLALQARLHNDGVWGPVEELLWEVPGDARVVLNEWNAVQPGKVLDNGGEDAAFGVIQGNGGAWVELLVVQDGLDLRGGRLEMSDLYGDQGTVRFTDHPVLADLRAGTLLTVAAELPEDLALDPDSGDWRFHIQASPEGQAARSEGFSVTQHDWQLTLLSAEGQVLFGPVGEGLSPEGGLSSREVGLLAATPDASLRPDSWDFAPGTSSTYGAPNVWKGGEQDLSALRGEQGDTGGPGVLQVGQAAGCGCGTAPGGPGGSMGLLLFLAGAVAFRRRLWTGALLMTCGCGTAASSDSSPDSTPGAGCVASPEVCNGRDDDCDGLIDDEDTDLVDGLPFYQDQDGDGFGQDEALVLACSLADGLVLAGGDCDDGDPTVYPLAPETCDDVDRDCDGQATDGAGQSEACAMTSCLEILELDPTAPDGAYFLSLPSGTVTPVWCDMEGGGWTLGFLRNSAATGNQGDAGAGEQGLEALAQAPAQASTVSTGALGWHDLNTFPYDALVLAAYNGGSESYRSELIPRDHLRIDFGEDGYRLYGDPSPYVWCGGDDAYSDEGQGTVDNPPGAPQDCRGHSNLGSGWDFSTSHGANAGLTLCGSDGANFLASTWGGGWISYGTAGGAQAIWVR